MSSHPPASAYRSEPDQTLSLKRTAYGFSELGFIRAQGLAVSLGGARFASYWGLDVDDKERVRSSISPK